MRAHEIADQFFIDAERDGRQINEVNLRAWLWFTCPAEMRVPVERAIRADERMGTNAPLCPYCNIPMTAYAGWGRSGTWWVHIRICSSCGSRTTRKQPRQKQRPITKTSQSHEPIDNGPTA